MIITEIRIRGFGALHERAYRLHPQLNVLYGPNEAGKSTLLGFIRAVLFGFPTRAQSAERYEPEAGGPHGGSLMLEDELGRSILVERYAESGGPGRSPAAGSVKVTLFDGTTGGEELLRDLLGGLSAELFRSLFAFGLGELQELRTLQSDEIGGYLYGAGFGVSGSTVVEGERKLSARADTVYKPRGRNQELNRSIRAYEELRAGRLRTRDEIARYEEALEEMRGLEHRLESTERERREVMVQLDWVSRCVNAYEPWLKLRQTAEELDRLPEIPDFPVQAVERYETLRQELDALEDVQRTERERIREFSRRMQNLQADPDLLEGATELSSLQEGAAEYRTGLRAVIELETERNHHSSELEALLRELDEDWTEADLKNFPVSVGMKEEIRASKEAFGKWDGERRLLDAERSRLFNRREDLGRELADKQLEWSEWLRLSGLREENPGARTAEEAALLRRLAADYAQWKLLQGEAEQRFRMREEEKRREDELRRLSEERSSESAALYRRIASAAAAMTVLLPAAMVLLGQYAAAAVIFALLAATTIWLLRGPKKPKGRGAERSEGTAEDAHASRRTRSGANKLHSDAEVSRLSRSTRYMDEAASGEAAEIHTAALQTRLQEALGLLLGSRTRGSAAGEEAAAGYSRMGASMSADEHNRQGSAAATAASGAREAALPSWPDTRHWLQTELESWQTGTDLWAQHRAEMERRRARLEDLKQELQAAQRQETLLEERSRELEEHASGDQERWSRWLLERKLRPHLSPEAALDSLQLISRGHALQQRMTAHSAKLAALKQSAEAFEERARRLLGEAGAADPLLGLKRRAEQMAEQRELLAERERLAAQAAEAARLETAAGEQAQRVRGRLQSLLREAHADGEEALRREAVRQARRAELSAEAKLLAGAVDAHAKAASRAQLSEALSAADRDKLTASEAELSARAAALEAESNALRDRRGRLAGELEKLEDGGEQAAHLQRCEEQLAEVRELGGRYAVLALASLLVKRTRERCESERQPGVLQRASASFAEMTGGRFIRVTAPLGQQKLYAVRADGRQVDTGKLSRGTAEQLYLAMRFALVGEFAGKVVLPLVFDDIFVNFDRQRMEGALRLLEGMSAGRQILLFTCHEHVSEAAVSTSPAAHLIKL
ncbi:AAA family ATPase [Paenibacillus lutrae]|uniref:AAA family ATPase n=1 Tax=Paenibacillus lutrae TaxID=2078573 RepID=A0A7X3FF71_9BACL|nr:AAA family ATPase [Paenibacillus lutrae]MVO98557.1 AAA family ATPase [Paenibacillus lutrae]